jgi:hypothetical protein
MYHDRTQKRAFLGASDQAYVASLKLPSTPYARAAKCSITATGAAMLNHMIRVKS